MRIPNDQTTHTIVAAVDLVFLLAAKFSCKQKYVITIQFDVLHYSRLPVTRTLYNSNLPLTRSYFHFPSDHFLYIFTLNNSNYR